MESSNYILIEEVSQFMNDLGRTLPTGRAYKTAELVKLFKESSYYHDIVTTFSKNAVSKAIGKTINLSDRWNRIKIGYFQVKLNQPDEGIVNIPENQNYKSRKAVEKSTGLPFREQLIRFLAEHVLDSIMHKKQIKDEGLRKYHFTKGIGEELYVLTESFYRQKGLDSKKHSISDFMTPEAERIIASGNCRGKLIYEHMVPKNLYLSDMTKAAMEDSLTYFMVYEWLNKYFYVCTIAREEENGKLPPASMGEGWDGENPFYRYEQAGIEFRVNIYNQGYRHER